MFMTSLEIMERMNIYDATQNNGFKVFGANRSEI